KQRGQIYFIAKTGCATFNTAFHINNVALHDARKIYGPLR
ncbi:MAG: hypothetical protein ACI9PZ_001350, partial [Parvicella sp.]